MPQINSISNSVFASFGIEHWLTGLVLAIILSFVIIGGIKRIVKVTEKLVPAMAIIYFVGAISVILYNYDNIIPSLISILSDVFTGSAATGGFLGASIAFAFNRGVNRGLFSNEAGQGSAPIAHAAAKAHEPVSEGMVAILEPFIDTIIICSLTGLTLLSSGTWNQKHHNTFQFADLTIMDRIYDGGNIDDQNKLSQYIIGENDLPVFSGNLSVENGLVKSPQSFIHARSLAENVLIYQNNELFSGDIEVFNGKVKNKDVQIEGESLLHSAPLTAVAFTKGFFGDWAEYIVTIGLLLFAFSTAIAWSYYGDRAVTYLWGVKYVNYYRIIYIIGFFLAAIIDTTIIWTFSGIAIAFMTLPNLIGILILRKDMKETVKQYWEDFRKSNSTN
jgi:AGCS family alanine or glycine:cation symporter